MMDKTINEMPGKRWKLSVQKINKAVVATVYEWEVDAAGFESWAIFSGWREKILSVPAARVTAKLLDQVEADALPIATQKVEARMAVLKGAAA